MLNETNTLRVNRVTKHVGSEHGGKVVIQNCSFSVDAGKFTVIVGPSGCGKTTLINLIAGYETPTAGTLTVEGTAVGGPGTNRLVVFQESALFPWMTALDNVMYGPLVRDEGEKGEIKRSALDLLKRVGLAPFADKYPMQLSGGMQRRAELARALINNPKLLLMDEPFRGLDHMTRELMQEYLLVLFEERGGTIVFVTSEIDEAIFLGDQIIVLSASPAKVRSVINVDLPRPRRRQDMLGSPHYAELKRRALDILYEEAMVAFGGRKMGSRAARAHE